MADEIPAARPVPAARAVADRSLLLTLGNVGTGLSTRKRAGLVVATVCAGTALAAGGVVVAGQIGASNHNVVQCHTTLELGDGDDFSGSTVATARAQRAGDSPSDPVPIYDAVSACADLWRQGVLREGAPNAQGPTGQALPVPPLVACVTRDGVAAVFPSSSPALCGGFGLKTLQR